MKKLFLTFAIGSMMLLGSCSETENKNTDGENELNQFELAEKSGMLGYWKEEKSNTQFYLKTGNYIKENREKVSVIWVSIKKNIQYDYPCLISESDKKIVFKVLFGDEFNMIDKKLSFSGGGLFYENQPCIKIK